MRTLVPLRDVAGSIEGWQFTVMDPIERPPDALDCLKRPTEQRPLAKLRCIESRPHDRLIEPLYNGGKRVIQATRGSLSLLARGREPLVTPQQLTPATSIRRQKIANKLTH
jgi:hypothetical protein